MSPSDRDPDRRPGRPPVDPEPRLGVHTAVVLDVVDPDNLGRVRLGFRWEPEPGGRRLEAWARVATLMAGADRGSWFLPDVGDEVLVAFEAGDSRRPYVVGALWNDQDRPPESMDRGGENHVKSLRTRSGIRITFDDSSGEERVVLETPGGNRLELDDGSSRIDIEDSRGNRIRLDAAGVTVETSARAKIAASQVEVSAGQLSVDAAMATFSGVVKCTTLMTNSVIASSYTPGAGNVW